MISANMYVYFLSLGAPYKYGKTIPTAELYL